MSGANHRATSIDDALARLRSHDLTILAGATDIYPARTSIKGWGKIDHRSFLDISDLRELRGIEDRGDHWWIGALTTWRDIVHAPLPAVFDALKAAAREIGGAQIQNRGTIGGNCCTASPAGDCIPCLLALDAAFDVAGGARRLVPAAEFFTGYRQTALTRDELLRGVRVPKQRGRSAFRKLGARRYLVISIAMVAAVVDLDSNGCVITAKIAIGACSATAQRLSLLETALVGQHLNSVLIKPEYFAHLAPIDDIRASACYRRHAALEMTRTILAELATSEVSHD